MNTTFLPLPVSAAFTVAQRMARDSGEPLSIGSKALHKRLKEKKLLKTTGREGRLLVRGTLEGVRRNVLHLHADTLLRVETDQSDQSDPKNRHGASLKPSAKAEDER